MAIAFTKKLFQIFHFEQSFVCKTNYQLDLVNKKRDKKVYYF